MSKCDLGPHAGFGLLQEFQQLTTLVVRQRLALASLHGHLSVNIRILIFLALLNALVTRIAKRNRFLTVQ